MKKLLAVPCAMLFFAPLQAQIAFGGEPLGAKAIKMGLPEAPVVRMPDVDAAALMAEDDARAAAGIKGPYRFGYNHATDLTLQNSGVWSTLPNGDRVWRLAILCPGAYSINFEFNTYVVPSGAHVFVWNDRGEHLGAFTAESNPGHTELGVTQLPGNRITIEYHEPVAVAGQGQLRIGQVTHAYRDIFHMLRGLGDSGSCNNNVICPEGDDWRDQIASVAMITVGGSGLCTGQLLNDCNNSGIPYFLTANHCVSGGVGGWVFRFKWESPTCTPTTNGPTSFTISGCNLLVNSANSDVALLQLNSTPPDSYGIYYSGWNATGDIPATETCIHHPSGDIKKISFNNDPADAAVWGSPAAQTWHIPAWDDGTTEPGSSGSGLWDQDHRLIGQLYGGQADCSNNVNDYFGRFSVSYPLLQPWLGSCGNTVDGFDPNFVSVALDASVLSIGNVDANYCNATSIAPDITIKNTGLTALTSLDLLYNLDGGANSTYSWTGTLATGATATVTLPSMAVGNGDHTLNVTSDSPNGGVDGNPANDSKARDFHVTDPGQIVTLSITLDDYGSETTWRVLGTGGVELYAGGPYADGLDQTVMTESLCLGDGCFTLEMNDEYGDGMCCDYGNGHYEVTDGLGTVLVTGNGQFNDQITHTFCLSNTGTDDTVLPAHLQPWPNPADGSLNVAIPTGARSIAIGLYDATGRRVRNGTPPSTGTLRLDVRALAEGMYQLEIVIDGTRYTHHVSIHH